VESVAAGFVGLDFEVDPGDLTNVGRAQLPQGQTDYWDFAHLLSPGDPVLIIVHHFPFALVAIEGAYNYIKEPDPNIGVWFRHFRRIDRTKTKYYADLVTNAKSWDQMTMTDAIAILKDPAGKSHQLIATWP
jgi:hypothetical protein